jgi:hypothetical protein
MLSLEINYFFKYKEVDGVPPEARAHFVETTGALRPSGAPYIKKPL